jgi:hypothetical protein
VSLPVDVQVISLVHVSWGRDVLIVKFVVRLSVVLHIHGSDRSGLSLIVAYIMGAAAGYGVPISEHDSLSFSHMFRQLWRSQRTGILYIGDGCR